MKALFIYLILSTFYIFTKGKLTYKNRQSYALCNEIETFISNYPPTTDYDFALNAQNCRLNDPTKDDIENADTTTTDVEELKKSKCCYISVLENADNPDWYYFCGKITSTNYENKISKYTEDLTEKLKNKVKQIKIDCLSKKLDFTIIILIITLIYLI